MYVQQEALFPFESFVKNVDEDDRIFVALSSIDVQPIMTLFPDKRLGRPGFSRVALFRALVLQKILHLPSVEALVTCLRYSPQFLHWCGFDYRRDRPSATVFYRFQDQLARKSGHELLDKLAVGILQRLAPFASSHGMIILDSTDIPAREAPPKRKKGSDKDEESEKVSPLGSAFGHRTASEEETEIFYGYKYHAACVLTDLGIIPLAGRMVPANVSDMDLGVASWLMQEACCQHEALFGFVPPYYVEDAGYDRTELYKLALELDGQAIIKMNKRNQKQPPIGFTKKGTPLCPGGRPMAYWGADGKHQTIKFRCPKAVGQKVDCQHECNCHTAYGLITRLHIPDNLRLFNSPHRDSDKWRKIYSHRSSIERWFSVLKEHLALADMTRRGIQKSFVDVIITIITFLAGTLAQAQINNRRQKAA